jgi:hypothetical protein
LLIKDFKFVFETKKKVMVIRKLNLLKTYLVAALYALIFGSENDIICVAFPVIFIV